MQWAVASAQLPVVSGSVGGSCRWQLSVAVVSGSCRWQLSVIGRLVVNVHCYLFFSYSLPSVILTPDS